MDNKYKAKGINKLLVLAVIILILTVIYMGYTQKIPLTKKAPIKIGFVGSLASKQSEASQALDAVKIAINEINNLGGIGGSKIELIMYTPNSEEVEPYFVKLANQDKVLAVISTLIDKSDAIEKLKIPAILIGPDVLTAKRKEPFYWSLINSFNIGNYLSRVLLRRDINFNIGNAIVISDATSSLHNQEAVVQESLKEANIDYLGHHSFYENNLSGIVADIKDRNPSLVLLFTSTGNAVKFFNEAKKQDLKPKVYLGGFEMLTSDLLGNADILPKNLYLLKMPTLSLASYPSIRSSNPAILKSINEFDAVNEKFIKATGKPMETISLNAYDSVYIVKDVIERSNSGKIDSALNEDRETIMSNLWRTKSFKSLRGSVYPDGKTGFLGRTYNTILVIEDGKLKVLGS